MLVANPSGKKMADSIIEQIPSTMECRESEGVRISWEVPGLTSLIFDELGGHNEMVLPFESIFTLANRS